MISGSLCSTVLPHARSSSAASSQEHEFEARDVAGTEREGDAVLTRAEEACGGEEGKSWTGGERAVLFKGVDV
jgi:hypothetical protein